MNKSMFLIRTKKTSAVLEEMIESSTRGFDIKEVQSGMPLPDLRNSKIIFAAELDCAGYCMDLFEIVNTLVVSGEHALEGSTAVLMLRSNSQYNSKSSAQSIIFNLNRAGCRFPGHPLVESIEGFMNFATWQKHLNMPLKDICMMKSRELVEKLYNYEPERIKTPKIVALHASSRDTSNTLMLWRMVKENLKDAKVEELHVESGEVVDCRGCSFNECIHYGSQNSCYYGGAITNEILPAIGDADVLVWICPNYNDAISAKLMAIINRLTVIYRKTEFDKKNLFAIIVSGNSGNDSVARQLIGSLSVNKNIQLPPNFALMAIANDPGTVVKCPGINEAAKDFAKRIIENSKS